MSDRSDAADLLAFQLRALGIKYEREVKVVHDRKWRFDFVVYDSQAVPDVAVEVHGGVWIKGGGHHQRGQGFTDDCQKACVAAGLGYRVMPVTPDQIRSGDACKWIENAIAYRQRSKCG